MLKRVVVFGIVSLAAACSAAQDGEPEGESGADQAVTATAGAKQRAKDAWAKLVEGRFALDANDSDLADIPRANVATSARDGVECVWAAFSADRILSADLMENPIRFKRWKFEGTTAYAIISRVPLNRGRPVSEGEGPKWVTMFDVSLFDAKGGQVAAGTMAQRASTRAPTVLRWSATNARCPIAGAPFD